MRRFAPVVYWPPLRLQTGKVATTTDDRKLTVTYVQQHRPPGCLRRILVGLGLLQSVSYIKSILTHEKLFAVVKNGPKATFNLFISWVGLALGWGVRRFQSYSYVFQPNRIW